MGWAGSRPRSGAGTVHGSRQVDPAVAANAARRSATRRASGPSTPSNWLLIGMSTGSTVVACGIRPRVGFSAVTPQHCAGQRNDPSVSLPNPSGVMPVASATASPPLDAPGVRDRSHGLTVAPHSSLSVCQPIAKSGRLVWPIGIAPAARIRSTTGASIAGYAAASALIPWLVGVPARSMFPLTVNGTPCSGGNSPPLAAARSAARAASRACPASTTGTALTAGFRSAIRRRCASTTSRLDASWDRITAARSVALIAHSPAVVMLTAGQPIACRTTAVRRRGRGATR